MADPRGRIAMVLVACATIACQYKEAATAAPADASGASPSLHAGDPLAQRERSLEENAAALRALGVVLDDDDEDNKAEPPAEPVRDETAEGRKEELPAATRCDAICQLADTACELRGSICDLAQEHVGESRYEAACWRATDQCTRASTACEDCRGTTAGSGC